jgi:hypothetical protein
MAPQTNEFGTKVGLLAGLVVICAARPVLDRFLPEPRSATDQLGLFASGFATGGRPHPGMARTVVRTGLVVAAVFVLGAGIVVAGTPARGPVVADSTELLAGVPRAVDAGTFPAITVDVEAWDGSTAAPIAQGILVTLAENLELENQALLRRDPTILTAVDHGDRLMEMQGRLQEAEMSGRTVVSHYLFDSVHVVVIAPFGVQTGGSIGFESRGTVTKDTYDAAGALLDRTTAPFARTFALRRATGDRWMNVADLPLEPGS